MKLLFAVIGDPENYTFVKYVLNRGGEHSENECKVESKTSFSAIAKCLNVDKNIVIAGVSLSKEDCNTYEECSNNALNYVKKYITEENIIIAPNIYGKFKGKTDYFFSYVYIRALEEMEKNDIDEVILDITHGINYMSLLAKEAITLALATYVASKGVKDKREFEVKFTVYNSDPIIQRYTGPYRLNVVSEILLTQLSGVKYITSQLMNNPNFDQIDNNKVIKEIKKKLNLESLKIGKLCRALNNGIFLYLIKKADLADKLLPHIEDKLKEVEINKKDSNYHLKSESSIILSQVHSLLYVVSKFRNENDTSLDDIYEYAELLCDDVTKTIIHNEIDKIRKMQIGNNKELLSKYSKGEKGFDKRILYAHGGLPAAVTYVWKKDNKIYVDYKDIDLIENNL